MVPDKEDHPGRFCILLEPLDVDGIGLAVISGVCPVRLNVDEESDTFAEIEHEETGFLKSGGSGSATILWKEPATGANKWAVVRLGDAQPIIRKAEMIDTLQQGDTAPAKAWLLKYEAGNWERTDKQIDLYGDQGFRGVAFGKTATVDAGDKIDVYYSHEAKHWYGVVGGWYFHGDVVADILKGDAGQVQLNVGAGSDERAITVPAYSPYSEVKANDFVSVTWNTFSLHWDIGSFEAAEVPEPACGLEMVNAPGTADDGKLRVKVADLAGVGLEPAETGCELTVDPGCGIGVNADGVFVDVMTIAGPGLGPIGACSLGVVPGCGISVAGGFVAVDATQLAGNGLSPAGNCQLQVNTGCGLSIEGGVVAINTADLVGNSRGLKTVGNCGIEVNAGCGLKFNFDELMVDADLLAGNGLEKMDGTDCSLRAHLGCGLMFSTDGTGAIEVNPFSIAGKGLTGNEADNSCLLDVQVGCGLKFDGDDAIEVDPAAIAGSGLTAGDGCTLDVMVGCGLFLNADGEVAIDRPALMGPGLKVGGEGDCDLGIDCDWIKYHCDLINLVEGCGIIITSTGFAQTIEVDSSALAGKGLFLGDNCAIDVSVGCGLQLNSNEAVEVNNADLAGNGLNPGTGCTLDVDWSDIPVGCGLYWNGTALEVAHDELVGNGLTLGSGCALDIDCAWISENCEGSQGPQGYQGYQGNQGYQGSQGYQGFYGPQGPQGYQGYQGYQGHQGYQGYQGNQGLDGPQGSQGFQGNQGSQGVAGANGVGTQGPPGTQGPQGTPGSQGSGSQGPQGYQGAQGSQGQQGPTGSQGSPGMGTPGPQGPQGSPGSQGATGSGTTGPQGPQGATGPQGAQGASGSQVAANCSALNANTQLLSFSSSTAFFATPDFPPPASPVIKTTRVCSISLRT